MMSSLVTITNNFIVDYTYQDDHTYMYLVYFEKPLKNINQYSREILNTEYSLRIIYNLQFEESNFWLDIYSFISLLLLKK